MKKAIVCLLISVMIVSASPLAYAFTAEQVSGHAGTQIGDYVDDSAYAMDEYGYSVSADEFEDYIEEQLSDSESSFLYDDLQKIDFSEDNSFSEEKTTLIIAMGNQKIKIDALSDGEKIKSITSISYSQKADLDEIMNLSAGAILYHSDHSKIAREAAQDIIEKTEGSGRVTLSVDKSGEDTRATENSVLISVLENK